MHRIEFYLIPFSLLEFVSHVLLEQLQVHDFVQRDFYVVEKASRAKQKSINQRYSQILFYLPNQIDRVEVLEYHEYVKVDRDLKPLNQAMRTTSKEFSATN